jgi:hypothetical protein
VQPAGRWEGARNQDARGRKRGVAAASGLNDRLGRYERNYNILSNYKHKKIKTNTAKRTAPSIAEQLTFFS